MKPICKYYDLGYCALSYGAEYDDLLECSAAVYFGKMVITNCKGYEPKKQNNDETTVQVL